MRAATWEGVGRIEVGDLPDPVPGPGDVLIDVGACGICGSDVHSFAEGAWIAQGHQMGHEYAGVVRSVGEGVRGVAQGQSVAVIALIPCGACPRCAEGRTNLCARLVGAAGGLAEKVLVPQAEVGRQLFVLPAHLTEQDGALLEPFSVAARAVAVSAAPLDEPVLVLGCGTIGLGVVQILKARGAVDVVAVDVAEARCAAASRLGADLVLNAMKGDIVQELLTRQGTTTSPFQESGSFGAVFECSGAPRVLNDALHLVRAAGQVVLVALTSRPVELDVNAVVQKELNLVGSFAYTPADCQQAFDLMSSGDLKAQPLITATYPLQQVQQAFQNQQQTQGSIKVLVLPPSA